MQSLRQDAELFYQKLNDRPGKFGLTVSPEKTGIIAFRKYSLKQNGAFDFLGFEFRRDMSRNGKPIIKRRISPKKRNPARQQEISSFFAEPVLV